MMLYLMHTMKKSENSDQTTWLLDYQTTMQEVGSSETTED